MTRARTGKHYIQGENPGSERQVPHACPPVQSLILLFTRVCAHTGVAVGRYQETGC